MDNAPLPSPAGAVDAEGGQATTPDGETPEVELIKEVQGDEADIIHMEEPPAKKNLFSFASWTRKAPASELRAAEAVVLQAALDEEMANATIISSDVAGKLTTREPDVQIATEMPESPTKSPLKKKQRTEQARRIKQQKPKPTPEEIAAKKKLLGIRCSAPRACPCL